MPEEVIIEVNNLTKKFGKLTAVNDLSFAVSKHDIYGFLGPNGSGKSTTIRMLLSLLRPDDGDIKIFGKSLIQNRRQIVSRVGSFIEKADFYEYLSAKKNLEILAVYSGLQISQSKIMEILELVGLKKRAHSKVRTFSKGMKQRLGIAQALIHDPELLILDEPASGLDPSGNRDIRDLIRYLNKERDKTIILSSHNLQEIETIANSMVIINNGKKVVEGKVSDLLNDYNYFIRFKVSDTGKAHNAISNSNLSIEKAEVEEDFLKINCLRSEVPAINKFLVDKGFDVETIKIEQNLEDYFLEMT